MMPPVIRWTLTILLAMVLPGEFLSAQQKAQQKAPAPPAPSRSHPTRVRTLPPAPGRPSGPPPPQLALQLGHSDRVTYVAFSGDGRTLVTAGADQTARLWDVQQGELRAIIPLTAWNPLAAALSPDGAMLAVTAGSRIQLWGTKSGRLQATLASSGTSSYLAFSPDGKSLAGAGVGSKSEKGKSVAIGLAELWALAGGRRRAILTGPEGNFCAAAFSPDGKILATGGFTGRMKEITTIADTQQWRGEARLWDARTGALKAILKGAQKGVYALAFSPSGRTVATGSDDHTIALWDVASGKLQTILRGNEASVRDLLFSPDGEVLATAGGTVRLWDVKNGRLKQVLPRSKEPIAFTPDSTMLATGGRNDVAQLWDVKSGQLKAVLRGTDGLAAGATGGATNGAPPEASPQWENETARAITFSPDGKTLATGSNDKAARLWDVASGRMTRALQGHSGELWAHVFSPDGRILATSSRDRALRLWDSRSGQLKRVLFGPADWEPWPPVLAFSPDGKLLAAGGGVGRRDASGKVVSLVGGVWLWNVQTGQLEATLQGQQDAIHTLAFSPDGSLLATGGWDKTTGLWDLRSRQLKVLLSGHPAEVLQIAFSADGKRVATGSGLGGYNSRQQYLDSGEVRVWDVQTGQLKTTVNPHAGRVEALAFSPDGQKLVSRFRLDHAPGVQFRLWDAGSGKPVRVTPEMKWSDFVSREAWWITTEGAALTLRSLKDGRACATLLPVPDVAAEVARSAPPVMGANVASAAGEWFVTTPEGYFDCSANAAHFIQWNVNGVLYPAERYLRRFRRPDLVQKALRGERIAAPAMTTDDVPPTVKFLAMNTGDAAPGDPLRVSVEVRGRRNVKDVVLLVNGRPLAPEHARPIDVGAKPIDVGAKPIDVGAKEEDPNRRLAQRFTFRVPLPLGAAEIHLQATAYDTADLGSDPVEVVLHRTGAAPVAGRLYVLSVGVSRYRNADGRSFKNLRFPAADARAMAERFQREGRPLYEQVSVRTLTDEQATTANLRAGRHWLQESVRPGQVDTAVIFLSGHGVSQDGRYYFAPHDLDLNNLPGSSLSGQELREALGGKLRAKAVFLFVDTCHAGGLSGWNDDLALEVGEGVYVIASSGAQEYSYESEPWGHGAFTLALLRSLGRRDLASDGSIRFNALAYAVPDEVANLMKAAGRNESEQEPCVPLAARRLRVPIVQAAR